MRLLIALLFFLIPNILLSNKSRIDTCINGLAFSIKMRVNKVSLKIINNDSIGYVIGSEEFWDKSITIEEGVLKTYNIGKMSYIEILPINLVCLKKRRSKTYKIKFKSIVESEFAIRVLFRICNECELNCDKNGTIINTTTLTYYSVGKQVEFIIKNGKINFYYSDLF